MNFSSSSTQNHRYVSTNYILHIDDMFHNISDEIFTIDFFKDFRSKTLKLQIFICKKLHFWIYLCELSWEYIAVKFSLPDVTVNYLFINLLQINGLLFSTGPKHLRTRHTLPKNSNIIMSTFPLAIFWSSSIHPVSRDLIQIDLF